MKPRRAYTRWGAFIALLAPLSLTGGEPVDITLTDGRVLNRARIVNIGKETVAIVHAGGATNVPPDLVPLDILGRAHLELERDNQSRKQREDATARAKGDDKKDLEIRSRIAEATVRSTTPGLESKQRAEDSKRAEASKRLASLKSRFPRVNKKRYGKVEIEVPHVDVWSFYNSTFQTATIGSLPRTVELVERRMTDDVKKWSDLANGSGKESAEKYRSRETLTWLNNTLRPYVDEARGIASLR